ncbi:VOC family protein [Celerinatantimonas diazotrophica]|uniref:Glyoxalase-like protein n=1 Tax=Celerinatantimonas diazotrophica TaxID=412034 RepID=A0A4R1J8F7_9GAMM|nr:VOC family protein [Celerinatantimonas diazotrophica]TCK46647.1 glyoxalase-like protein [Celerinatantimonas diazotrophica]CAG9295349.1 hypothetical protein CEDIAZO_00465 [Celerinatantimonas diazotrophica]
MDLELDHVFILTKHPKEAGDLLVSMGLDESFSRDHPGQGTANRRFVFSNGMLEILYVRDSEEAKHGPARNLRFPERIQKENASPFGIVLTRTCGSELDRPYSGWTYQPDYFEPPNAFHVGDNSAILEEPLSIYVPFIAPVTRIAEIGTFKSISRVRISIPLKKMSETLSTLQSADRLELELGAEHMMILTLDHGRCGLAKDLRPVLPLIIHW